MGLFSFPPTSPLYLSHLASPLWGLSGSGGGGCLYLLPSLPSRPLEVQACLRPEKSLPKDHRDFQRQVGGPFRKGGRLG